MELDIRKLTEELILKLWTESDKLRERAEGVKLLFETLVKAGEAQNGQQHTVSGIEEKPEEQVN